ncbi:MAG: hypothetical protein ACR2J3_05025 [Aridibacter sp.]
MSNAKFFSENPTNFAILKDMQLKICDKCKRPYLAAKEFCPNCPEPYTWNQESVGNLGCLLATIIPLFLMILFWLFFFFGLFFN